MNLSTHITFAEFTRSSTAARLGIDNTLPGALIPAARVTADMLERIRAHLCTLAGREIPIIISSGYRCERLNRAVGGSPASDHVKALAVDFEAPAFGAPVEIARVLAPLVGTLSIGQLINEFPDANGGGWVHVSTRMPDKMLNRVLTISAAGTKPGVHAA